MESTKKEDIIIELGSEFIRVGLVGDKVPRKTIRSGNVLRYQDNSDKY
jgi:actin-related protein